MILADRIPCTDSDEAAPMSERVSARGELPPKLFDKVLIPIEVASEAKPLISLAESLAATFHSQFLLVHVAQHEATLARNPAVMSTRKAELEAMAAALRSAGAGSVTMFLREGSTASHAEQIAREHFASLVLVMEHAEQLGTRAWFGTLTQRLARRSATPLMVVKATGGAVMKPILCVVDFSEASKHAVKHAVATARENGATISFLHVVAEPLPMPLVEGPIWHGGSTGEHGTAAQSHDYGVSRMKATVENNTRLRSAQVDMERFLAGIDLSGVKYDAAVAGGAPVVEVLTAARARRCGAIFVGSDYRGGFVHYMSQSTAETLAETAPVPVLIFRGALERIPNLREQ
jgi:universal stress protein E